MNVKNGMASSVSLPITWKMRSGSAWKNVGENSPGAIPASPHDQSVEGQREGDRVAEEQYDDQRGEHERSHVGDDERGHGSDHSIGGVSSTVS